MTTHFLHTHTHDKTELVHTICSATCKTIKLNVCRDCRFSVNPKSPCSLSKNFAKKLTTHNYSSNHVEGKTNEQTWAKHNLNLLDTDCNWTKQSTDPPWQLLKDNDGVRQFTIMLTDDQCMRSCIFWLVSRTIYNKNISNNNNKLRHRHHVRINIQHVVSHR